jgi:decaprenylphospho-beta-D-erythro-pentofuranosid-2-ulose 2-reductase
MQDRKTMLLLGATSDIGRATALQYAQAGWQVLLAARNVEAARREADDIATRTGAEVGVHRLDILETDRFEAFIDELPTLPDGGGG